VSGDRRAQMAGAMILLVGEQPAPNLLPARHLQPEAE
jgi:hypothetical protein